MRVLDLFCGAGGAAMGLHRAWPDAEIIGVDIKLQPRYPFTFVQADALRLPFNLAHFDFVWASPPCQGYSRTRHLPWLKGNKHPLLIEAVRQLLRGHKATCIENVEDAPLVGPVLTGEMFGLPFRRGRRFETSFLLLCPQRSTTSHALPGRNFGMRLRAQHKAMRALMPWADQVGADQAIPPAYSEFIARQLA